MQRFQTTGCLGRVVAERCLKIWESAWLPIDVVDAFVSETLAPESFAQMRTLVARGRVTQDV